MYQRLRRIVPAIALALIPAAGQPQERPAPPQGYTREPAALTCPTPLGPGVQTGRNFCDVLSGTDPASGVVVSLPPHRGAATLTFDLHNRHTYSEEQVRANRAFTRYTAVIGVLTMDGTLLRRAAVQSEFRRASDLVDRVSGGAGPGGVKAVAATGTERIAIEIPEAVQAVSILGELLTIDRAEGTATYSSPGRPIAVISDVQVEYRPAPPQRRPGG